MAAALFTQSCSVASNLYATAISSLNTSFPTLLPSSPSAPIDLARFSVYGLNILNTQQLFSSPLPFALASIGTFNIRVSLPPVHAWMPSEIPLEQLSFWQVAHALLFIGTVGVLSWMLDSHHSDDDVCTIAAKNISTVADAVATAASSKKAEDPAAVEPSPRPRRRRPTLETIATLIKLEDVHRTSRRRKSCSPIPPSLFLPHCNSSSSSLNATLPSSAPASPTDVHGQLIPPAEGTSTKLLKREMTRRRRKSIGVPGEVLQQQLAEVAEYDARVRINVEAAQQRREGSWRTKLLLGLRVPVRWTMN
ncbi:hypothetical protein TWF696_005418 [Orbilia brochopaga]|uniref:Uncharacterized protein n=1 Tax=Orbilia brochopaga TaxID=3140254 RepID=A0AAV9V404_9PEZI